MIYKNIYLSSNNKIYSGFSIRFVKQTSNDLRHNTNYTVCPIDDKQQQQLLQV